MIILQDQEPCVTCGGTGKVKVKSGKNKGKTKNCPSCEGKGWLPTTHGLVIIGLIILAGLIAMTVKYS